MLKDQNQKSTKSHDDIQRYIQMINCAESQKHFVIKFTEERIIQQNQGTYQSEFIKNQITQEKIVPSNQNDIQSPNKNINQIKNKRQYIESIKQSYLILQNSKAMSPENNTRKRMYKKSFIESPNQQQIKNQVKDKKIKQDLKTPLNIDMKKLDYKNVKLYQLNDSLMYLNGSNWEKCQLDIDSSVQQLILQNLRIPFASIQKIKIFKPNPSKSQNQIKLAYSGPKDQEILFLNCNKDRIIKKLPGQFILFEQILTQKLKFQNKFKEIKWQKTQHVCEQIIFGSYIFGQIYKKSQTLGNWQVRYVVLNNKGIFSYKSAKKKQEYSFHIDRNSIQYMWTRFDFIENYLVMKLKHGLKKTQFAIPITNFSSSHYKNWLYYFYKIMMPGQ